MVTIKDKAAPGTRDSDENGESAVQSPRVKFSIRFKLAFAIIALVSVIIITMAIYVRMDSSEMLRSEIISFAQRETEHLAIIAEDAYKSGDDLSLISSIENLKKVPSIEYAYLLDNDNFVRMSLDPKKNGADMSKDAATLVASKNKDHKKILRKKYPDPKDSAGEIYDFSKPLINPLSRDRAGTVRLGFSDRVIRKRIMDITYNIIYIALIFLGLSILGSLLLSGVIIKPIRKLSEGAAEIGRGNLDYRIGLDSSDELGKLAYEFNVMTTQLKKGKDIEIEKRIMDEQVDIAKEIQEGLNPMGFYNKKGIEIKGFTRAAKGVGGDYFDYIDINENMVGALISDVSGKGVPASLVMVMIRTVFVTQTKDKRDVQCAHVVRTINDSLSADFAIDKFATLFFMIFDRSKGELSFSNAGHGPLMCFRSTLNSFTVSKLDGVPIGIMDDVEYRQGKVTLNVGDIVVLYTDGVTEMRNEKKDEYGSQRFQRLLKENNDKTAEELVNLIITDVDTFRGNASPHDDMTLLILKRTG
ncbi:MAG TPA: SpoIIE family protein phosphatase [Spirochaetota bacterium]|nr:SpoIIE family protein phosphatase [Spirochaetota bacterium]